MNIPPPKSHPTFNLLIREEKICSNDDISTKKSSNLNCDESECILINNIIRDNYIKKEEKSEKCKTAGNDIEGYGNNILDLSLLNDQDPSKSNPDFEKMDLSEINNEIEKTKESIKDKEKLFQQRKQEIQQMREASEKITLLKRKAIALYNEMVSWSQNELRTKYPHVHPQNDLPLPVDVYQNSSKDPDSISEQILVYFKDIKKQMKGK